MDFKSFNDADHELFIQEVRNSITEAVERKMEELHDRDTSPYITGIDCLAKYLGIGLTHAREIKSSEAFPCYQQGRTIWFKKAEIDKFIEKQRQ